MSPLFKTLATAAVAIAAFAATTVAQAATPEIVKLPRVVVTGKAAPAIAQLPRVVVVGYSQATLARQTLAAKSGTAAKRG